MKKLLLCLLLGGACHSPGFAADSPWKAVEKVLGRPGIEQEGQFKIAFPRTDLNVLVEGIPLEPAMALSSWFAFCPLTETQNKSFRGQNLMTGELVLLDQEVSGVLASLVENGLQVTALHNLVLGESPGIQCVQITGQGSAGDLARKLKQTLRQTGTPLAPVLPMLPSPTAVGGVPTPSPAALAATPASRLSPTPTKSSADDWASVQSVLGPGLVQGKILEYSFSRNKSVQENGMEIPPFLGTSTCFHFQKTGEKIAVIGTFALLSNEVNPMVKTLTSHSLKVTSINNHMLDETPRLIFLHFWGVGKPGEIARGVKTALKQIR